MFELFATVVLATIAWFLSAIGSQFWTQDSVDIRKSLHQLVARTETDDEPCK
jgi:hypothetical protein